MLLYVLPMKYGKAQTRAFQQSFFLENDINFLSIQTYYMCSALQPWEYHASHCFSCLV